MSEPTHKTLPKAVVLADAADHLREGRTVLLPMAGRSMEPLLHADSDLLEITPPQRPPRHGDIVMFRHEDDWLVHCVNRRTGSRLTLQGCASPKTEQATTADAIGLITAIHHSDGTTTHCDHLAWRIRVEWATSRNRLHTAWRRLLPRSRRKRIAPAYFVALAALMWLPLNGLGIPLNNFVWGIRMDHLVHASIYLPCALLLSDWAALRSYPAWLLSLAIGITTECVQYLLPYRGFDINDLIANLLGITIGWLAVHLAKQASKPAPTRHQPMRPQ